MKIVYWYSIETGFTVTTWTLMPDDVADRNCDEMNRAYPMLYHWTVGYFPAV